MDITTPAVVARTPEPAAGVRPAAVTAGVCIALMAVLAPLGLMVALPAGAVGVAAVVVLVVAVLDVVIGVSLYPVLQRAGALLAGCAGALRVAYAAVFAAAAGWLVGVPDVARFQAAWDAALFVFGVHLLLVGAALIRGDGLPSWIGALVVVAGGGYLVDAVSAMVAPTEQLSVGAFTFGGEVVLLVWLIGWGGRVRARQDEATGARGVGR